ncbi:MAG: protein translocase subunit SecD [Myxococcota bacterium]
MSLRARAILVGIIVALMSLLAFPNLYSEEERLASVWIPDDALSLGLDLQGGIHWLLRIDDAQAVLQEVKRTQSVIAKIAEEDGIALSSNRLRDGRVVELEGDLAGLRRIIDDNFETFDVEEGSGVLSLSLTEDWRESVIERGVQQALEVLNERIDGLGVREPVIAPQGAGRILVQMPGEIDPVQARTILEETTFLEFKKVLTSEPNEELLRARYDGARLPEDTEIVLDRNDDGSTAEAFLVPATAILTGAMLEDARIGYDRRNRPLVTFTWNSEGTRIFREFTGESIGERLAAIIDGEVVTAPVIQSRIGRNGQITGGFTAAEAAALAVALRSGALPIPLVIEEERSVGPALGADSIRQGVRSILLGGALVIVFMGAYYSVGGWFANLTLIVNMVMIIGAMSLARATLTLPGIAGLVLTVGMAVDANVIIFERIREEIRSAKNLRNAIQAGFRRSQLTILDANVTTLIAAIVLLQFGRGPVQGFGVTLAIGIVASVFGALVVTRLLVDLAMAYRPQMLKF